MWKFISTRLTGHGLVTGHWSMVVQWLGFGALTATAWLQSLGGNQNPASSPCRRGRPRSASPITQVQNLSSLWLLPILLPLPHPHHKGFSILPSKSLTLILLFHSQCHHLVYTTITSRLDYYNTKVFLASCLLLFQFIYIISFFKLIFLFNIPHYLFVISHKKVESLNHSLAVEQCQLFSQKRFSVGSLLPFQVPEKAKMSTLTTPIQYHTGGPSLYNKARKRSLKNI